MRKCKLVLHQVYTKKKKGKKIHNEKLLLLNIGLKFELIIGKIREDCVKNKISTLPFRSVPIALLVDVEFKELKNGA